MRKKVDENLYIKTVLYKTTNVLLLGITNYEYQDRAFIICEGFSLSVNGQNHPCQWGKNLTIPDEREYARLPGNIIAMYFPFECQGLQQAGEDLAFYINENMRRYKHVVIIGHSKAGVCIANMARMLKRKVTLMTVSAPFKGTDMADIEKVKERLSKTEFNIFKYYYNQHPVDLDIMPNSYFLKNVADFSGVEKQKCINVVTECIWIHGVRDILCKYLAFRMGYKKSDGIVTVSSQKSLSDTYSTVQTMYIDASHVNSLNSLLT